MGSLVVRMLAVGAAPLLVTVFGTPTASADPLTGKTYDEAASLISGWRGTAIIGSVSGSQLVTDECVVTSWQKPTVLDSRGRNSRVRNYVLHLNCNNALAAPGHPGNSAMTPEGAQRKVEQEQAASISKNPAWCETSDKRLEWCQTICERTGLCEV